MAKSDIDLMTDKIIAESRSLALDLMTKFYKRNPDQLRKTPEMIIDGRVLQQKQNRNELIVSVLDARQGIDAMNLAFEPGFRGDRFFALAIGLGGMLRQAYGYKAATFMYHSLNAQALQVSSRSTEVLLWQLVTSTGWTRRPPNAMRR